MFHRASELDVTRRCSSREAYVGHCALGMDGLSVCVCDKRAEVAVLG